VFEKRYIWSLGTGEHIKGCGDPQLPGKGRLRIKSLEGYE